jgi:hypothetical protein
MASSGMSNNDTLSDMPHSNSWAPFTSRLRLLEERFKGLRLPMAQQSTIWKFDHISLALDRLRNPEAAIVLFRNGKTISAVRTSTP